MVNTNVAKSTNLDIALDLNGYVNGQVNGQVARMHEHKSWIDTSPNFFDIERFPNGTFAFREKDYALKMRQEQELFAQQQKVIKSGIMKSTFAAQNLDFENDSMKNFVMNKDSQKPKAKSKKQAEEDEPEDPMFEIQGDYEQIEVKFEHMDDEVKEKERPREKSKNRSGKVLASAATEITKAPENSLTKKEILIESDNIQEAEMFQKIFEDLGLEEFGNAQQEVYILKDSKDVNSADAKK